MKLLSREEFVLKMLILVLSLLSVQVVILGFLGAGSDSLPSLKNFYCLILLSLEFPVHKDLVGVLDIESVLVLFSGND